MTIRLKLATCFALLLVLAGCERPGDDKSTLGTHTLTIVDTSGKPLGGNLGTRQDDVAGTKIDYFESANGRYKITLENEVLTINGDRYTLEKPGSEIRIEDDTIQINGVTVSPETE